MAAELILVNDIVSKKLYRGLTGSNASTQFAFSSVFQGEAYAIKFFPVVPSGNPLAPWTQVSVSNLTLKVGIGPRDGAESRLAAQDDWAKVTTPDSDGYNNYLSATLDLNTTQLNNAIGDSDTYTSFFEIQLGESGVYRTVYQSTITITPVVIGPNSASSLPSAAAQYYTKAEIDNLFVKFQNAAGQGIVLVTPLGKKLLVRAIDQNGAADFEADPLN